MPEEDLELAKDEELREIITRLDLKELKEEMFSKLSTGEI